MKRFYNSIQLANCILILTFSFLHQISTAQIIKSQQEEITFKNNSITLAGTLSLPQNKGQHPVIVFIHGDGPEDRTGCGYYNEIWNEFNKIGIACFAWDKPGVGKSSGIFKDYQSYEERASEVIYAIEALKKRKDIDSNTIGLWGISQAGWIMPMVYGQEKIYSIIAISCPSRTVSDASAYATKQDLIAKKVKEIQIDSAMKIFYDVIQLITSKSSYQDYIEFKNKTISTWPIISPFSILQMNEDEYNRLVSTQIPSIDAAPMLKKIKCPVLAIWGDKDKNVPPELSLNDYNTLMKDNKNLTTIMMSNADHLIFQSSGNSKEIKSNSVKLPYAEGYLQKMSEWLKEIKMSN